MTKNFFADSDFLTGLMVTRDSRAQKSIDIFKYLQKKDIISDVYDFHISNYIIMEVAHNLLGKNVPFSEVKKHYDKMMECNVFHIKPKEIKEAFNTKSNCARPPRPKGTGYASGRALPFSGIQKSSSLR